MFESLESRRLLTGIFYDAESLSVNVHGTHGNDVVRIARHGPRILVQLNDHRRWFDAKKLKSATVEMFSGNDALSAPDTAINIQAYGGDGFDEIITGAGQDMLFGGSG